MFLTAKKEFIDKALRDIALFEQGGSVGMFYALPRASIARGLRERVTNPKSLDQNQASLCGPAAFLYCLLNCRPDLFATYVIDLYLTGEGRIGDLTITPSTGCLSFHSNPSKIADVDWVALASLRDSENLWFQYSSPNDTASGATAPYVLAKWFEKAGFPGVVNETNAYFSKGLPTLLTGNLQAFAGGHVCLLVNDNMLNDYQESSMFCNHWVVLQQLTSYADDDIRFSVYTWGSIRPVPPLGKKMSRDDLSGNFYGYVSAGRL